MTVKDFEHLICEFMKSYKEKYGLVTDWRTPIVGVANANDELFQMLKNIVGPTHVLPGDIVPNAKSVITFFIPFSRDIVLSNVENEESSKAWDYACIETNRMIGALSEYLYNVIRDTGFNASNLPPTYNYDPENLRSDWSHRSAAYIAGIGKFGIHNMLITEKGCCGRIGSVITDMDIEPTKRIEEEYCLFKVKGICKKCAERCVNGAFVIEDKAVIYDRWKCNEQIYEKIIPHYPIGDGDACGKCMCAVPCSMTNPSKNII